MGVNRDGDDGDECFHDLLGFLYALQPVADGTLVTCGDFLGTAKGMLARGGVVVTPLRELGMAKVDFGKLVEFLLVMYLDGSEEDLKDFLRNFAERKEEVVAAFLGRAKEVIGYLELDEALSAGTSEIMGVEQTLSPVRS